MKNLTIREISTYLASHNTRAKNEHFSEIIAKTSKIVNVGDGSVIAIRNISGLTRHSLPMMVSSTNGRNTFGKNLFLLDTFGLKDNEVDFMYTATILTAIWEDETINENFSSVNRLASNLYNRWVAGTLIRQLGVDYDEHDNIKVVAGLYYILQGESINTETFRGDTIHRVYRQVAEASDVPIKNVKEIIDKLDLLDDGITLTWNWFFEALKKASNILRYRLTEVSAMTSISGSFYRGMVAQPQLALNYKPFFIAMLYTVFSDRSAARTGLDTLVKSSLEGRRRQQSEMFVGAIESIIKMNLSQ